MSLPERPTPTRIAHGGAATQHGELEPYELRLDVIRPSFYRPEGDSR